MWLYVLLLVANVLALANAVNALRNGRIARMYAQENEALHRMLRDLLPVGEYDPADWM